jgi:hypothetical protein
VINRSMSVAEYKRATITEKKTNTMSAEAPKQDTPMTDVQTEQPKAAEAPAAVTEQPPSTEVDFGRLFEEMCNNLPEDQRKVAISGQNNVYKELERLQAELESAKTTGDSQAKEQITKLQAELESTKKRSGDMEKMYEDNVKATIVAMKNFFEQGGENPNVTTSAPDYGHLEGHLKMHPEMANEWGKVVSCAASRINHLESALEVYKTESTKTSEERELFARMRGFQRDSAKPTYDYHGFENSKRPRVTENANTAAPAQEAAPASKKQKISPNQHMDALRAAMRRNVAPRPGNIRPGERGMN